uniref:Ribosomal protein S4 n=1 Tax=Chlorokybus atmophyticus TaxID=3144 RepID=A6YEB5_CHLAT|nr:ribosomal protein S4 [Chlorokybus atmophyticus]ABO15122.1 ribosomal protein S4 [Chlorokybus atmophyticus]
MVRKPILKFKTCRRIQKKIWDSRKLTLKQENILLKAQVSPRGFEKQSNYSKELIARQKLSAIYGNLKRDTFIKLFKKGRRARQVKLPDTFLSLLERRLDVVLLRLKYCSTLSEARQLISHKKILVNNETVNISSYLLKNGDLISIPRQELDNIKEKIFKNWTPAIGNYHGSMVGNTEFAQTSNKKKITVKLETRSRGFQKTTHLFNNIIKGGNRKNLKPDRRYLQRPTHLEINYKTLMAVFIHSPHQIRWPIDINRDLIAKFFGKYI